MTVDILEYITEMRAQSELCLEDARRHLRSKDEDRLAETLYRYILCRFLIPEYGGEERNIEELAEIGTLRIKELVGEGELPHNVSLTCTGVTSTKQKKILLMLSLEKALELHFQPSAAVSVETVSELAHEMICCQKDKKAL